MSDDLHNDSQPDYPFNTGPTDQQQQHQRQTTWPGWRNVKSSHGGEAAVFFGRPSATPTMADLHLMDSLHSQDFQDQWSSQGSFESMEGPIPPQEQQQQHLYGRSQGMLFDQQAAMQGDAVYSVAPHRQYPNQSPQVLQGDQPRMGSQHTPSPHHSQEAPRGFQPAGPHLESSAVAGPSSRPASRGQPLRHRHSSLQMTSMALQRQSPLRSLHLKTDSPIPEVPGERMAEVPGRIPRTGPTVGSASLGLYMTTAGPTVGGNGPHGFVRSFSGPQQRHSNSISPASNLNSPSWTSPSAFPTPGSAGFSPMTSTSSNDSRMMAPASPSHSRDPSMDGWSQGMTSASSSTSDFSQTGFGGGSIPRPKRKTKLLNIDRKRICEHAAAHPKMKQDDLAAIFGIERSTVSKVLKDKERWLNIEDDSETAKIVKHRSARFPEVETPLTHWAHQMIASGEFVSDSMLRSKALEIAGMVGGPASKFKASSGWIDKFRDRANLPKGLGSAYRGSFSRQSSSSYASFASSSAASVALSPISTMQMQFAQEQQQQQHLSSLMASSSRMPNSLATSTPDNGEMMRRGSTFSQHGLVQSDLQVSSQPTLQPTDGIDIEMRPRLSSSVEPMSEHDAAVTATPTSKQKRHYDAMAGGSMSFFGPMVPFPSSSSSTSGQVEVPERLDPAVWSPDSFSPEGAKRRRGITGLGLPLSAYGPSGFPTAASPTSHRHQSQYLLGSQQDMFSSAPRRPDPRGSTLTGAFSNHKLGGDARGGPSHRRRQSIQRSNETSDDGPLDSFLLSPSLRDRPISPLRRFRASELSRSGTIVASMYSNLKDGSSSSKVNDDENLYASPGSSAWDAAMKHAEGGDLASALPISTFASPVLRSQRPQPMRESRSINGSPTHQTGNKSSDEREPATESRQGDHSPRRQGRQYRRSNKNSSSRPSSDREAATIPSPSEAQAHAEVVQAFRQQQQQQHQHQLQSDGDGMAFSVMNLAPTATPNSGLMDSPGGLALLPSVLRRSAAPTTSSPFMSSPFSSSPPQGPSAAISTTRQTDQQQSISVEEARRSLNVVLQFLDGSGSNALNDEVSAARGRCLDLGAALQQGELWNRLATLPSSGEQQAGAKTE